MDLVQLLKRKRAASVKPLSKKPKPKATGAPESATPNERLTEAVPRPDPVPTDVPEHVRVAVKVEAADEDGIVADRFVEHVSKRRSDSEAAQLTHNHAVYHAIAHPIAQALCRVCLEVLTQSRVQEAWPGVTLEATEPVERLTMRASLSDCGIVPTLQQNWRIYNAGMKQDLLESDFVSKEQRVLFSLFSSYQNVFYTMKPYPTREQGFERDVVLDAVVLHTVNHVLRAKLRLERQILNRKRSRHKKSQLKTPTTDAVPTKLQEEDESERILGFTFPKVLFLVPMRNVAFRVAERFLQFLAPHQTGLDTVLAKLRQNYGPDEALEVAFRRQKKSERSKPSDHEALFHGHVADTVTIGIKVHLNGEVSVFRPLAESDVFIASPLSLSLLLEKKEREITDLLSSIEILVVERAEVLLMQNWQHVLRVAQRLNQVPKETPPDVNLLHVRSELLRGYGRLFRQTLILAPFATAEMNALFNGPLCAAAAGAIRFRPVYRGVLQSQPGRTTLHRFERHSCTSLQDSADARFGYFKAATLPKIRASSDHGILLFIPHYFDFLRVCEVLTTEGVNYGAVSEYTGDVKSQKLRRQLRDGEIRVLATTERAYFYNRPRFRGLRQIIFYALPEHPQFYTELVSAVTTSPARILVQFSRFSSLQLERIVGTHRAQSWIQRRSDVVTESV